MGVNMTDDEGRTGVKPGTGGVTEEGENNEVTSGRGNRGTIPGRGGKGISCPEEGGSLVG